MGIPQVPSQVKRGPGEALRAIFAGIGKILMAADRPEQAAAQAQPGGPDGQGSRDPRSAGRAERRPRHGSRRPPRPAPQASPASSRWRSLDQTGNVRLLTPEEVADKVARMSAAEAAGAVAVPDAAITDAADLADGAQADEAAWPSETPADTPEPDPLGWPAAAVAYEADLGDAAVSPVGWQAPADPAATHTADQPDTAEAAPAGAAPPQADDATAATPRAASLTAAELPLPGYDDLSLASIKARLRGLDVPQLRLLIDYENANAERPELLGMYARRIEKLESGR